MLSRRRPGFNGTVPAAGVVLLVLAALSWRFGQPNFSFYIPWGDGLDVTAPIALAGLGIVCLGIGLLYFIFDLLTQEPK